MIPEIKSFHRQFKKVPEKYMVESTCHLTSCCRKNILIKQKGGTEETSIFVDGKGEVRWAGFQYENVGITS